MSISIGEISKLREQTGVGVAAAKKALHDAQGDLNKAVEALRKSGQKVAASKASRATDEGLIGHYVHANGKIAALVVVSCETDFVARSEPFRELVHDLAVHVAAASPLYLKPGEVPAAVLDKEREIYQEQLKAEGKPKKMWDTIVEGKLQKFFEETCLLRQRYVKDDALTVEQLVHGAIQRLGENIVVRQFVRLSL